MNTFERYAPFIQDFIYAHEWENLRAIQVAAADAIFNTDDNVLLAASTASGKTEAAFFPILTEFWEDPPRSVGALYIGPLKALINDQFARLTDLCEEADIPVWHWHGDVAASRKARLMKNPSGILQITPESLEALLLRKHSAIARLFCNLRYIVIDEVHSLLRGDRGGQTLCLIERLGRLANVNPRRVGLSATIGDPQLTGAYLAAGTGRDTFIPRIEAPGRPWRLSMEHFYVTGPQAADDIGMSGVGEGMSGEGRGGGHVLRQVLAFEGSRSLRLRRARPPPRPSPAPPHLKTPALSPTPVRPRLKRIRRSLIEVLLLEKRVLLAALRGMATLTGSATIRIGLRSSFLPTPLLQPRIRGWGISSSTRAARSALYSSTRGRRRRRSARRCGSIARRTDSPTGSSSITAICRRRSARAPRP